MEPDLTEQWDEGRKPLPPIGPPALRALASVISYIFHPVFMPVLLSVVLWRLMPAAFAGISPQKLTFGLISLISTTIFFPLFTVALLKILGFIKSIHMRVSRDRIIPLIATMTFYFWAQQVFGHSFKVEDRELYWPLIIRVLLLGSFWGIILLFIGSIFFKISMHTTAAGGAVGIMIVLLFLSPINMLSALLATIVIGGIVGTSRLILREHTGPELWMGYAIGLIVQPAAWLYLSY
jgi:hypothetical protein